MKEFKFLRRNTWYNPGQQAISVCGTTTSNIAVLNTNIGLTFPTEAMSELVAASRELQERINILEQQTRMLRDDLTVRLEQVRLEQL